MKRRGLKEPPSVAIDGNSGLRKAVRECFPDSWVQRRQVHWMRSILCKLPEILWKAALFGHRHPFCIH